MRPWHFRVNGREIIFACPWLLIWIAVDAFDIRMYRRFSGVIIGRYGGDPYRIPRTWIPILEYETWHSQNRWKWETPE
jgi:hypothetical protein